MIRHLWKNVLPYLLMGWLLSCTGGCGEDDGARPDPTNESPDTPTYTNDIQPVIQLGCSCHQPGGPKHADVPLDSYERVFARRDRIRQRAGVEGSMPPTGPLDDEKRLLIITWIDGGAPE